MDSGNSGSLQSSSGGGDDEYDSRASASTTTAFINNHHHTLPNPPPSFHHPSSFDPLSNYFDPRLSSNSNSNPNHNPFLNLDPLIWSKPDQINPFLSHKPDSSLPSAVPPLPSVTTDHNPRATSSSTLAVRNPKKRTRASRRAPTTVLTTDTNNFRAMVQEFTGIPAPPFSSSSTFPRNRLDLFGTSSSIRSNPNTFDNTSPPPYLLRPFPQKLQPPSFLNSMPPSIAAGSSSNNSQNSINNNATFQANFLHQTIPSSSFLTGLTKMNNSVDIPTASSNDDHDQFGQMSGSMRDGLSNYNSYSTGSLQASEMMMNGNVTRGEATMESWICSTTNTG